VEHVNYDVDDLNRARLDRKHFSVAGLSDSDEKQFWLSKTPAERLAAVEVMRQSMYGYDPVSTRLQRVLTITSLGED
jgi:hypothetical protein